MRCFILILFLQLIIKVSNSQDTIIHVPIMDYTDKFEIVGELGCPLGTMLTIEGKVIRGPFKGYEGGKNIEVLSINGKSTQKYIRIPITPAPMGKFGKGELPKLKYGKTYRIRVYETGIFVGVPYQVFLETKTCFQTTNHYFRNEIKVTTGEEIKEIKQNPKHYIGEYALLIGIASNEGDTAIIKMEKYKLILLGVRKWNSKEIGKKAEVYGTPRKSGEKNIFILEEFQTKLTLLEDQIGDTVTIRGRVINHNSYWWFNYRGTRIYVDNLEEKVEYVDDWHWQTFEVSGILETREMQDLDNIYKPDIKTQFYIRDAKWKPIEELLRPEIPISY